VSRWLSCVLIGVAIWVLGCGGNNNSTTGTGNNPIAPAANNVAAIAAGNVASNPEGVVNAAFTSATICLPGTSNCATLDGLLVDTGSTGMRVLASVLPAGFSLPQQTDSNGNPIGECAQFGDGFTWGPVQTADMTIAGEKASSLPIQVINPNFAPVPTECTANALGPQEDTLATLGANGILGVGDFLQDCGPACAASGAPGAYFTCPASGCVATTESLTQQVQHPVALFATDNNGVIVELPSVGSGGAVSVNGSLVFGIGTQSNNGLNGATVLTLDANGNFTTVFKGTPFSGSFVDSGSNGLFFLDSTTTGMPVCTDVAFYCPGSTQNFSATNQGANGQSTSISFSAGNADTLLSGSNFLLPTLAAPNSGSFDWGLPFFYGRNIFVAIEGKSTPGGTGPYTAY